MLIQNGTSFQFREEGARDFYKEFTLKMANFYKPFMQLPGGGMASPAYSSSSEDSDRYERLKKKFNKQQNLYHLVLTNTIERNKKKWNVVVINDEPLGHIFDMPFSMLSK